MAEVCGECGEGFASAAELVEHAARAHPMSTGPLNTEAAGPERNDGPVTCVVCGAVFHEGTLLATHLRIAHRPEGPDPIEA